MDHPKSDSSGLSRRDFIRLGSAVGIGTALAGAALSSCAKEITTQPGAAKVGPIDNVRLGIVGVGNMGSAHFQNFLRIEGVEIVAVCDLVEDKVKRMQEWATKAGKPAPKGYYQGETDFKRMCAEEDLDLVFAATPWNWHVPVMVEAMKNGSHAATEVPAAPTIEACWEMVETAEKYNKHCVMMENVCYMEPEMMIYNMVQQGVFGELLHGEGAYSHDMRNNLLGSAYEGDWWTHEVIARNGNLYPTHGLGPIAQCMNISRGDRFDYLVSMSSNARGLHEYANEHLGPDHEFSKTKFNCGDINISMLRTVQGKTIYLVQDTNLPRPYSRINLVQGTKGITQGFRDATHANLVHVEGLSQSHSWEPLMNYANTYKHPLISQMEDLADGAGHGGADFIEDYRLIYCLRNGLPTDMDVYEAADWSVVSNLTEMSVANRSQTIDFPDFTRGQWKTRKPLGIIHV
ncbi:MAG: Gfo/Idh/MocA family oxidoreductase [Candidatus Marinimicrobia bacterium]|nr:Gfo/Idh/MocA family oxidoreductase [Candidatus Neomarinimicrobiota bacterium]